MPHDLGIVQLKAPSKITLGATTPQVTKPVVVTIQNRSPHGEIISNVTVLANLVTVSVQSLPPATCADHTGTLVPPKKFPIILAFKKKLKVTFLVTYSCANDPVATTKTASHNDYQTIATVHHDTIDGIPDTHPADDECPHGPLGVDPNPDGTIVDKGCGSKNPDGTLGAAVFTDVVVKTK